VVDRAGADRGVAETGAESQVIVGTTRPGTVHLEENAGDERTVPDAGTAMLELQDVHTYYGQIHALKGLNLTVNQGEIVALIGGNGAGKTTTLRTVSGMMKPKHGQVIYEGQSIGGVPAHTILGRGMSHVPEGRRIFPQLSVRENLEVGAYTVTDRAVVEERIQEGFALFPRLKERETQLGGTMSGGEQQMLAIARALMVNPRLLLLDEPSMASRRCLWKRSSTSWKGSTASAAQPSCWSNRTPAWRWGLRTAPTCSRPARFASAARRPISRGTRACGRRTWATSNPQKAEG